jgi:hypothetical protein
MISVRAESGCLSVPGLRWFDRCGSLWLCVDLVLDLGASYRFLDIGCSSVGVLVEVVVFSREPCVAGRSVAVAFALASVFTWVEIAAGCQCCAVFSF